MKPAATINSAAPPAIAAAVPASVPADVLVSEVALGEAAGVPLTATGHSRWLTVAELSTAALSTPTGHSR